MSKHAIPGLLAAADLLAAAVCAWHKDWPRAFYWLAAAQITASTILIGR